MTPRAFIYSVLASVVATLLILSSQPALGWIWDILSHVFGSLLDSTYSNASFGKRDWVVAGLVSGVMFSLSLTLIFVPVVIMLTRKLLLGSSGTSDAKTRREILITKIRKSKTVAVIYGVIFGFIGLHFALSVYVDIQLNASFDRQLAALNPHIDDQQEEEFRAKWALMDTRNDYIAILAALESAARDLDVRLPEPLIR